MAAADEHAGPAARPLLGSLLLSPLSAAKLLDVLGITSMQHHSACVSLVARVRSLEVLALGPCQSVAELLNGPNENAICPAKTLNDLILAAASSGIGGVVGILFEHDAIFLVGHALELGYLFESSHEDVHHGRPNVRLVPLLTSLDVARRNTTLTLIKVGSNTLVCTEDSVWVVLEIVGSSAEPEGIELGRTEEDLFSFGGILCVHRHGVVVGREVNLLRLGSQIVIEVAPKSLVPHESMHSVATVGSDLAPLLAGAVVSSLFVKVGNGYLISVENRVEVYGNDVPGVEVSQGEVVIPNSIFRSSDPLGGVVQTTLSTAGESKPLQMHIGLVVDVDRDRTVFHKEFMLLDKQRQGSLKDVGVVGVIDINLDHLRQQRWLRSVEVVDASTIGDKPVLLDKIKEVLNGVFCDVDKRSSGSEKTFENPVRVPVVGLTETTTRNDKRAVDRDEAVGAVGAVLGILIIATGQVRPNVNDLLCELPNDSVVDVVEELGIRFELIFRHLLKLVSSIGKVLTEEIGKGRVVLQRLVELIEGLLNFT
ncbi:hypothetical protein HG530_005332 [Fusarium avenaceum]|nr:hypothetical protein HG530_005332 [Fusarium avenaceum]